MGTVARTTAGLGLLVVALAACTASPQPQVNVVCGPTPGGGAGGAGNGGTPGAGGTSPGGGAPPIGGAPPAGAWVSATSNLTGLPSECGNVTGLFVKPDEDLLIAGIALQGLWESRDGGQSWQAMGTGTGSDTITNRPMVVVFDPDHTDVFYEAGLYNGGGVYKTIDKGATFKQLGDVIHSDSVSVDFGDPERKTLLAGGHEQDRTLNRSVDAGLTWTNVGTPLPANTYCTIPLVIDAQTHFVGCDARDDVTQGIFGTTDGGASWTPVSDLGGGRAPLRATDGSIYWANPDNRGLARSQDNGATWEQVTGDGVLVTVHPVELPDGRIATLSHDSVVVSVDQGATWTVASANLPYRDAVGVVYSAPQKAFFVWHFSCGSGAVPVPDDGIMRFDFDYETQ